MVGGGSARRASRRRFRAGRRGLRRDEGSGRLGRRGLGEHRDRDEGARETGEEDHPLGLSLSRRLLPGRVKSLAQDLTRLAENPLNARRAPHAPTAQHPVAASHFAT